MSPDEPQLKRVPTLAQYCYRYINSHLDSIVSLGTTPYLLVEPVLRSCSAEQLLALEKNSPHLENEDQPVWRGLCFRDFPRSEAQYEKGEFPEPQSWRDQYFVCRAAEERRLEEVGSRIKSKREEEKREREERQVVYTDRVPPAKRSRFNPGPSRPKTLFEKTRAESIKIQRSVYGPAMLPPMSTKAVKPRLVPPPKAAGHIQKTTAISPGTAILPRPAKPSASDSNLRINPTPSLPPLSPSKSSASPSMGSHGSPKKNPMTTLFMPKHRAHSQLSTGSSQSRHK